MIFEMEKKIVFWSPIDPCVEEFFVKNPSLPAVSDVFPYVFVCTNGIDKLVKERCGDKAITIEARKNNMRLKGTTAFEHIRGMDFDICIRLDIDTIVFDLKRLISMASVTKPNQLLGWKNVHKKNKKNLPYIRGGCHACGRFIIDNIAPLGHGSEFDYRMTRFAEEAGGEIVDCRLFEESHDYAGSAPAWHPVKKRKRKTFDRNVGLWTAFPGVQP
jgi:hypothetical protein